jgi:hypothetical protein
MSSTRIPGEIYLAQPATDHSQPACPVGRFSRHFTHLKSGEQVQDRTLLLSTILADAINLGLTRMAQSCPGATYSKLSWLQAWHIRDSQVLVELLKAAPAHCALAE